MTIKNVLKHKTYAGLIVHNGVETSGGGEPVQADVECEPRLEVNS